MSYTRELLRDGNFVLKTTRYHEDRQDMDDFQELIVDPYASAIGVNYHDDRVEVPLSPGW
jgi:hypothetical protein